MPEVITIKGKNPHPEFIKMITGVLVPAEQDDQITIFGPEDLKDSIIDRCGSDVWDCLKPYLRELEETGTVDEADLCYEDIEGLNNLLEEVLIVVRHLQNWPTERKRWQRESVLEQVEAIINKIKSSEYYDGAENMEE